MSSTTSARFEVSWVRSAISMAAVNAFTGVSLGALYAFYSFGFDWTLADPKDVGTLLANSLVAAAIFGLIVPTSLSLLILLWGTRHLRSWPVGVFLGPALTSLLSFLFIWSFPIVLAFIGIALTGGILCALMVWLVRGVRRNPQSIAVSHV